MSKNEKLAFSKVIEYFIREAPRLVGTAQDEFIDLVDPDIDDDDIDSIEMVSALALEWFLFDYRMPNNNSPLENFIRTNPLGMSDSELSGFKQSVETNYVSIFSIEGAHPEMGTVVLEDMDTKKRYPVLDYSLSSSGVEQGILGARIVKCDGAWYFAGNPAFAYPIGMSDNLKRVFMEEETSHDFPSLVRMRFGHHDSESVSCMTQAVSADMSAAELRALLLELEMAYKNLSERAALDVSWEELTEDLGVIGEVGSPLDKIRELFSAEDGFIDIEEDALNELLDIYFNAWNATVVLEK
ncbi:hypothetical protein [Adlercreutzia sp. ZJ154]|uniref:hypothetical protein n=1 Tax=Adlercreutzia sp. ZJ154 TaxID=2709790 RepID=UPI0013EDA232|nr:hypothetical protein [Adlercreutzia sp. ZJ154]